MAKRVRPAKHYQHPRAPQRLLADQAIPGIARAFKPALKVGSRLFDRTEASRLIAAGRWREVAGLVNWSHAEHAMVRPLAMVADVYDAGGRLGARKLNGSFARAGRKVRVRKDAADRFNFDLFNPQTSARIRQMQDELISSLGDDARNVIQQTVLAGLRAGRSPDQIAGDIKAVIGLTNSQAQAVMRFRGELEQMDNGALDRALMSSADKSVFQDALDNGQQLSQATIDQLTSNYADAYLSYRATTIATSEATNAMSLGLVDSYQQAVDSGVMPSEAVSKHWQIALDEKTCDHCLSVVDQNPDGVGLDEQFDTDEGPVDAPGLHPNCRCSLEMVTDLSLLPEDDDASY